MVTENQQIKAYYKGIQELLKELLEIQRRRKEMPKFRGFYADDLPFFALHIYLKKSITESLFKKCYTDGYFDYVVKKELKSRIGFYMKTRGSEQYLPFKNLLAFTNPEESEIVQNTRTILDLTAYHNYLYEMEYPMTDTPCAAILYHLYTLFNNAQDNRKPSKEVRDKMFNPIEWDCDMVKETFEFMGETPSYSDYEGIWEKDNSWCEVSGYFIDDKGLRVEDSEKIDFDENTHIFRYLPDNLVTTFYVVTGVLDSSHVTISNISNRSLLTRYLTDNELKFYIDYLHKVIRVLLIPEYKLGKEFVLKVLRETYMGLYKTYFFARTNEFSRRENEAFISSKAKMRETLGLSKDGFYIRYYLYGLRYFSNEQIQRLNNELGTSFILPIEFDDDPADADNQVDASAE